MITQGGPDTAKAGDGAAQGYATAVPATLMSRLSALVPIQLSNYLRPAQRVYGVTSVSNYLTVRPVISGNAEDREVRTAVLHALMLDSSVPATIGSRSCAEDRTFTAPGHDQDRQKSDVMSSPLHGLPHSGGQCIAWLSGPLGTRL
jgi:hypothetical protein